MTPTNDNATAGLLAGLMEDHLTMCRYARLDPNVTASGYSRAADTITALQARVAEVEAERDYNAACLETAYMQRDTVAEELDAALSREKEAKASLMDALPWLISAGLAETMPIMVQVRAALAQSGGADPAQGKGDAK